MNLNNAKHGASIRSQIYGFIIRYLKQHGYPPSVREIGAGVGLSSTSSVHHHLKAMIDTGMLETDAEFGSPRALRVPGMKILPVSEETSTTIQA